MAAPGFVATEWDAPPAGQLDPEGRLAELARAGGPLRRVVAALAGRLAAGRGWERLGFARPGDYARERLGLSGRSLHDFARVDRALAGLPALEAALVSGRLPWSKVRLLAGIGTAEDERRWIAYARRVGVRGLEKEVRAVDRGSIEAGAVSEDEEGGQIEDVEPVRIHGPARVSFKWHRTKEYASRNAGERLSPGAVLEMVTAEALSSLGLDPAAEDEADEGTSWSDAVVALGAGGGELSTEDGARAQRETPAASVCTTQGSGPAVARAATSREAEAADVCTTHGSRREVVPPPAKLPPFLRPLMDGLDDADAFELDARLRRAVRLEQRLDAEIAPLLRHVTASEYAWRVRYQTLAAYARERLGMSPRKARALLRLERVGDVCPELRATYRDGRLSWVQGQTLAPLLMLAAEGPWRVAWVAHAQRVTVRRLEEDVDRALLLREVDPVAWDRCREHPERLREPGPPGAEGDEDSERQTCARPREDESEHSKRRVGDLDHGGALDHGGDLDHGWRVTVGAPRDVARLFRAVLCTVRRGIERETGRLPTEAEGFEAMLDHALRSWDVDDPWLRRRLRREYAVFERDGWRCTVPGCTSRRNLHAHHILFRSAGGGDELTNQTTLCAFHHQRGVHAGIVRVRGAAPTKLWFELGIRTGRAPLARYRSGDRVA